MNEEPPESGCPRLSLTYIPFKNWAWPEEIKDHSVEFTPMACLATAHFPAPLITRRNTLPRAGPGLGIPAWGRPGFRAPRPPLFQPHTVDTPLASHLQLQPLFLGLRL